MHLFFVRHGQSYVNLSNWEEGNLDQGLTELGQKQAEALARWMPKVLPRVDSLYTSTMRRALETSTGLAEYYKLPLKKDDRLREIGNNRIDHSPWPPEELPRDYSDYWASERPFSSVTPKVEQGESLMHFRTRVGSFIEEMLLRHVDGVVVAVCHGGVIEAAFDHIFNIGPWRRAEVWQHNAAVSYIEYVDHPRRESWRLHFHNRVDHLTDVEGDKVALPGVLRDA